MKSDRALKEVLKEVLAVNERTIEKLNNLEKNIDLEYEQGHTDGYILAIKGVNDHIREALGENYKEVIVCN